MKCIGIGKKCEGAYCIDDMTYSCMIVVKVQNAQLSKYVLVIIDDV